MFDRVGIYTGHSLHEVAEFYSKVLAPLGLRSLGQLIEPDGSGRAVFGTGHPGEPFFVIAKATVNPIWWRDDQAHGLGPGHIAFGAPSKHAADAFYEIGPSNGAKENGPPGERGDR